MELFIAVFPAIFAICCVFVVLSFVDRGKEKSAYNKMINNPTDETVSAYILALKKINGNFMYKMGSDGFSYNRRMEDRHRQAQGWNHLKTVTTVSEAKKNELKSILNRYGANVI